MSAQVLTYLPTFKEAAVFRLQVLNKDAAQVEKRLHELEKTFYKAHGKYQTTFINKAFTTGNVRKIEVLKKLDWQLQSERAAKIELYALTGIDKEHWVL